MCAGLISGGCFNLRIGSEAAEMACAHANVYALSQQAGARLDGVNAGRCAGCGFAHGQPTGSGRPPRPSARSLSPSLAACAAGATLCVREVVAYIGSEPLGARIADSGSIRTSRPELTKRPSWYA